MEKLINSNINNQNQTVVLLKPKSAYSADALKFNNSLAENTMNLMIIPSIDHSPLSNLKNSIAEEKEMRQEFKKKGINLDSKSLSFKQIRDKELKINSCVALNSKIKRVLIYAKNLKRFESNKKLNKKFILFLRVREKLDQNIVKGLAIKSLPQINANSNSPKQSIQNKKAALAQPLKELNSSANTLQANSATNKAKETIKRLPSFVSFYSNISVNESKEGIFNNTKPTINLHKYIKNLTSFDVNVAANQTISFKFVEKIMIPMKNLYKILEASLNRTGALISQPYVKESANEISINVFYFIYHDKLLQTESARKRYINHLIRKIKKIYRKDNEKISKLRLKLKMFGSQMLKVNYIKKNLKRLKFLCETLSQIFKKKVNLELTRVYLITSDSQILANAIGYSTKKTKFNKIKERILLSKLEVINPNRIIDQMLFKYNSLFAPKNIDTAHLSGVSVRIAGRVPTEKVVPRRTVREFQIGSLSRTKAAIVKTGRFSRINKRGTFSVTVKTGYFLH